MPCNVSANGKVDIVFVLVVPYWFGFFSEFCANSSGVFNAIIWGAFSEYEFRLDQTVVKCVYASCDRRRVCGVGRKL